jgi:hypothetical protein
MVPLLPPFRVQAFSHSSEDRTRIASAPKTDRRLQAMADNPLHQRNADELTRSDVVLNMERSIIESATTATRISLGQQRGSSV